MTSPVNPFSYVTIIDPNITDPNNGGTDTLSITFSGGGTLTDGADFAGTSTLSGSNGSYTLTGTAAAINAELDALSFNGVLSTTTSFTLSDQSISTVTVSFTNDAAGGPKAGLIIDAAGNLFGTTTSTVFELVNIGTVSAPIYSGTPTTVVTFNGQNGGDPLAGLTIDAAGDLLGTTSQGGQHGSGTVFEIANTGTLSAPVYSSTLTTLVSVGAIGTGVSPQAGLTIDAAGDLFGTTAGLGMGPGSTKNGTVFEIANTGSLNAPVYGTLTTLVKFDGTGIDGVYPLGSLIIDAAGDLFGTTSEDGSGGGGTVFELVNTGSVSAPVYSSTPTTLATFSGVDGENPVAGLTIDAAGDLFGTTSEGGDGIGTVFEIANGTLTTLVSFNGAGSPADPQAGLIVDAAGDLFGTTVGGGANNFGTVFELVNTGNPDEPYELEILWSFTSGADGAFPYSSLTTDAAGDLFGTTLEGGTSGDGAAFELVKTDNGYTMAPSFAGTLAGQTTVSEAPIKPFSAVTMSDFNNGAYYYDPHGTGTDTLSIMFSGGGTLTDGADFAGTRTLSGSNGSYTLTGTAVDITTELDALSFTPHGVPNTQVTTHFTLFDQSSATLHVLASFDSSNGANPVGSLISDATGDLLGTTRQAGPGGGGTVFEIANTGTVSAPVYSSTPTTLVSFTGSDLLLAGLVRDAAGDLFGTTAYLGGSVFAGSVFEIANTGSVSAPVYSSTATTLVSLDGTPAAGLTVDAAGNLFGTTESGGPGDNGTVFEIANTGSVSAPVYSSTPTTLWFFTGGADGSHPTASLISDAAGDLIGTASEGGTGGLGTVFEIANTGTVSAPAYGSAPTTLASFGGSSGLIINAAGDLFGASLAGGPAGSVFELVNTGTVSAPSYGSTPATLVSFTGNADGGLPFGGVVSDAAGNLFGTTNNGGANSYGTVFEIVNTGSVSAPVYSHTPTTLWAFTGGADGGNSYASLTIDAGGDLFGTASEGGPGGLGTVFELVRTGSVYTFLSAIDTTTSVTDSDPAVAPTITGTVAGQTTVSDAPVTPFSHVTITDLNNGGTDTDTLSITFSGGGTLTDGAGFAGTSSLTGSNGSYTLTGTAAAITTELHALSFTPVGVLNASVTTTFTLSDTSTAGTSSASDSVTSVIDHDIEYVHGTASGTTLNGGYLVDYGTADSTTVNSGGIQYVQTGATASGTVVNSGGTENVYGSATGTTVNAHGTEYVWSGGTASGTTLSGSAEVVYASGTDINTTVGSGATEYIYGSATGTTVGNGGNLNVLVGGTASTTAVNSGGTENVYGSATGTTVNAHGTEYVWSGGAASGTTLSGGIEIVQSGGSDINATVGSGGLEYVYGSATGTTVNNGGIENDYGTTSGAIVNSGGTENVYGSATGTTVNAHGTEYVWSGGAASGTTLSGGIEIVQSGGSDINATVGSGGLEYVYGSATGTTVNNGGIENDYGTTSGAIVNSGGTENVYGSATGTTVNAHGTEYVWSGGAASGTTLSGGIEIVQSGGSDINATVGSGGLEYVYGSATGTTVNNGGIENDYGTTSGAIVNSGGTENVYGSATGTTVNAHGTEYVWSGGTASGTTLSGSAEVVYAGGTDINTTVGSGATEYVYGAASGTTISGGTLNILAGGSASGTITFAGSGQLTLNHSTGANNFQVAGFNATTEKLDLTDIAYLGSGTTLGYTSTGSNIGTLTVSDGGGVTASITLLGNYIAGAGNFTAASDGHGGTIITDPPVSGTTQSSLVTQPQHT